MEDLCVDVMCDDDPSANVMRRHASHKRERLQKKKPADASKCKRLKTSSAAERFEFETSAVATDSSECKRLKTSSAAERCEFGTSAVDNSKFEKKLVELENAQVDHVSLLPYSPGDKLKIGSD